ncbi:nucleotidyltransferase family protein [Rhizobium laguerreae]|uniref:nucleotidyltransferase family protein n=1 Tax=Rhizobium laguerreae TaxID=1076926 RepID=UPI001C907ACF|nr:nucleotidyltransferase family protein [Rhizobium laguerreae]MBY3158017.1 nucleotidyltransferase family protein [Rhizobium laguerreae]MBY3447038.1 nucleotidyltransferase family protein [Rhizobium laguerreae]
MISSRLEIDRLAAREAYNEAKRQPRESFEHLPFAMAYDGYLDCGAYPDLRASEGPTLNKIDDLSPHTRHAWLFELKSSVPDLNSVAAGEAIELANTCWRLLPVMFPRLKEAIRSEDFFPALDVLRARLDVLQAYEKIQHSVLITLMKSLRDTGLGPLFIKGMAAKYDVYQTPSCRIGRDIDLAFKEEDWAAAWHHFLHLGFKPSYWSSEQRGYVQAPSAIRKMAESGARTLVQQLNHLEAGLPACLVAANNLSDKLEQQIRRSIYSSSYPWVELPDGRLGVYIVLDILFGGNVGLPEDIDSKIIMDPGRVCVVDDIPCALPRRAVTFIQIANKMIRYRRKNSSPFYWVHYADLLRLSDAMKSDERLLLEELVNSSSCRAELISLNDEMLTLFPSFNSII